MQFRAKIVVAIAIFIAIPVKAENYAFLVAVQEYDVKDLKPLNYTRSDIAEFAKVLQKSGFRQPNIVVLNDKPDKARYMAVSENIRKELDLVLAGVETKDTLIVAFSGHGVQFEGEDKNYYCPLDADLEDAKRTRLIAISEIYDKLKQCPAEKKLLLVDACRNDPLSPVKKSRATVNLKSVTRPQTEPLPKGIVALYSCSAGQESYEWPGLKHGVFFHHVLEGWNGAAAEDGKQVTLDGLVLYSRKRTQEFARLNLKAVQTPQLKSEFAGTWILHKLETSKTSRPTLPSSTPATNRDSGENEKELVNSIGMKLRLIPAGTFLMGSHESDKYSYSYSGSDERPQHRVQIAKAFYLGKFEVTQGEWKSVMDTEPWKGKENVKEGDDYPATHVNWEDATNFCKKLSGKDGNEYRLPTEAEWEYACRGGKSTRYHFGNDERDLGDYAWYEKSVGSFKEASAHRVGQKKANQFGLHDMHGNVLEWCSDWYHDKYLATSPLDYLQGPATGSHRVIRGGGFYFTSLSCRSACRDKAEPSDRSQLVGFRVARSSK